MRTPTYLTTILVFLGASILTNAGATDEPARPLKLVVDQAPLTLNPRMSLDGSGQRIGAMIFSGLTRINARFEIEPDLARSWKSDSSMKRWVFTLDPSKKDHSGQPIRPEDVLRCLEEYRAGKPRSLVGANFTRWKSTRLLPNQSLEVQLEESDPYFPKNATLLKFFRWGVDKVPCSEPAPGAQIIGSGPLRPEKWDLQPHDQIKLLPIDPHKTRPLHLYFVRDELARLLRVLRGNVDGGLNSMSLSKHAWLLKTRPDDFKLIQQEGANVQYLAFNLTHPILAKKEVRQALSMAVDRKSYCEQKSFGYLTPVGSFLSPILPEALQIQTAFNPEKAEQLLDASGYPRGQDGVRFTLKYKTTPLRDGFEIAQFVRENLKRIGVRVELETVEPALLIAAVRAGNYEMHSSRWIGVSDASILWRTLHSSSKSNRARYKVPEVDRMLDAAMSEADPHQRTELMKKIQHRMAEDLPYAPLWIWNSQFVIRKDRAAEFSASQISPSAALEPLTRR
jgi:peptide/nickel transport system substrate-binding protein